MTSNNYNSLNDLSRIGLIPLAESIETIDVNVEYYIDEMPKKLTKANSFIIFDEVMLIRKKDYLGKATKIYHIFRASDGRLVTSIPSGDKDYVIKLVTKKWLDKGL